MFLKKLCKSLLSCALGCLLFWCSVEVETSKFSIQVLSWKKRKKWTRIYSAGDSWCLAAFHIISSSLGIQFFQCWALCQYLKHLNIQYFKYFILYSRAEVIFEHYFTNPKSCWQDRGIMSCASKMQILHVCFIIAFWIHNSIPLIFLHLWRKTIETLQHCSRAAKRKRNCLPDLKQ